MAAITAHSACIKFEVATADGGLAKLCFTLGTFPASTRIIYPGSGQAPTISVQMLTIWRITQILTDFSRVDYMQMITSVIQNFIIF